MARRQQAEFPGGHLACGQLHALLKADEWTALQWMRFRFAKADSAVDLLMREQPMPPGRADEIAAFIAIVLAQSSEPLFPLRYGRGAHLQRDVQALVSRAPKKRGGPVHLRNLVPLETAITVLGGLARRAPDENQPVIATSAMTLLRTTWEARRSEIERDEDAVPAELVEWLEESRPGVGAQVWWLAIDACVRLEEAAVALATHYGPAAMATLGPRAEATLSRRVPGFPNEVYSYAIGVGLALAT